MGEAITVLFCEIDDGYARLNPRGGRYTSLKRRSDSEVITLALFQQLRRIATEHSFLREAARFFSHLFPGSQASCRSLSIAASARCGVTRSP